MADQVIRLGGIPAGGVGRVKVIFLYDLTTNGAPYTYDTAAGVGTGTVVFNPVSDIPADILEHFTAAEQTELTNGTHAYEVVSFQLDEGVPPAQTIDLVFADRKAAFVDSGQFEYRRRGQRYTPGA